MKVFLTPHLRRVVKKLQKDEKAALDKVVYSLIDDPEVGELKRGDLAGIRVYKYKVGRQQYLLAYRYADEIITLLALGTHENFYRDLKR